VVGGGGVQFAGYVGVVIESSFLHDRGADSE